MQTKVNICFRLLSSFLYQFFSLCSSFLICKQLSLTKNVTTTTTKNVENMVKSQDISFLFRRSYRTQNLKMRPQETSSLPSSCTYIIENKYKMLIFDLFCEIKSVTCYLCIQLTQHLPDEYLNLNRTRYTNS